MTSSVGRLIAIGDIHGCSAALDTLIARLRPQPEDTLVFLGDYVDRGPDSRGVIERLIALSHQCEVVPILGNHDEVMRECKGESRLVINWLMIGGTATLESYGVARPSEIPASHFAFLNRCIDVYETQNYFFVHALYVADKPLDSQPHSALRWEGLKDYQPPRHRSGKTAIVGHTSQRDGTILDLGHIVCIDTYCYGGGWLTALDLGTGEVWQANREGVPRKHPPRLARLASG